MYYTLGRNIPIQTKGEKMTKDLTKWLAFTLAEVLITLAIIGIVAALTIPALVKNFQQRIRTSRIQNIQQKLSHATDKMMVIDGLNGYGTQAPVKKKTNAEIAKEVLEGKWGNSPERKVRYTY